MIEFESLRFIVAISMLIVSSYYDLKTRVVSDLIWVVFGTGGVSLYMFDWSSFFPDAFFGLLCGLVLISLLAVLRLCGKADILAIAALSTTSPVYNETPTVLASLSGLLLASAYSIASNICKNANMIIKGTRLFSEIKEPNYKKVLAFFVMHGKTNNERYGFSGVNQENKFTFRHNPDTEKFTSATYVTVAIPLMPFLLGGMILFFIFKIA
ncbi:MAG: prepilin peptidase [Thermoproteota archaeon]